jgi:hypothetical protein
MTTLIRNPRDRDYLRYPIYIADGSNKIQFASTVVTITPGWYYNCFYASTPYRGLWSELQSKVPSGVTLHICTPTLSHGQIGCGVEFRRSTSITVKVDITDGLPRSVLGWTQDERSGVKIPSQRTIPGIWRSNSLLDGIASLKNRRSSANAFASHDDPDWIASVWRVFDTVDFRYQAVPAVYVNKVRGLLQEYTAPYGIDKGDIYAAFEHVWLSMIRSQRIVVHGDISTPPDSLAGCSVIKGATNILSSLDQVARREDVAQERYEIAFDSFYIGEVP